MTERERLLDKLEKVRALAERGVGGGERERGAHPGGPYGEIRDHGGGPGGQQDLHPLDQV